MFFRIIRDAYKLFDRRWQVIVAAALISVGVADGVSWLIRILVPMPLLKLAAPDGNQLGINYNDFVEAILFFFANIWFEIFIALVAKDEIDNRVSKFGRLACRTMALYPRVFLVNLGAQAVLYTSLLTGIFALSIGGIGVFFLIPAIFFAVWFSLVTPVAVIDNVRHIRKALVRSRILTSGFFWTVLLVLAIGFLPALAISGIRTDTVYFWPVVIFINICSVIIGTTLTVTTYVNLRLVKGDLVPADLQKVDEFVIEEEAGNNKTTEL